MANPIAIRRATKADIPTMMEIWRRAIDATHDFIAPADRAEVDRLVAEDYFPIVPLWVAAEGGAHPLAFLGMTGNHIDSLFVDPDVHGRGIGRALVAHALDGRASVTVDVNEQNEKALGFYERLGFRRTGRSATDGDGRPYPLIHYRCASSKRQALAG